MQKVEGATKVERLVKLLGDTTASELDVGGFSASQLAEEFSTPYYVYNGDVIVGQIQRLRQALGPETDIYYSLKANPSLGLCQLIARQDLGAEVASIGELLLAQKAGFPPDRTIFAGPGKTRQELELATRLGVKAVNVESEGELGRLGRIAESARHVTGVGIRVNPYLPVTGAQMRMGGGSQQFGIDEEALDTLLAQFNGHPYLQIRGLHVYVGTQIFDVDALVNHFHHVVDLSLTTADRLGRAVDMVDFGGGFGVPYFDGTEEFDLDRFAVLYRDVVARCKADSRLDSASLIVELGRYLVAEAGVYVTRVTDVKVSRGKRFVVTDGGMNHHITATGNFGQVFRKPYPIAPLGHLDAATREPATLVGPCCTPLDIIAQNVPFPHVEVGDLVGIFCSGAYGYSASSLSFLSHPTPAEILVWQGRSYQLRAPGQPEAVLDGQSELP